MARVSAVHLAVVALIIGACTPTTEAPMNTTSTAQPASTSPTSLPSASTKTVTCWMHSVGATWPTAGASLRLTPRRRLRATRETVNR